MRFRRFQNSDIKQIAEIKLAVYSAFNKSEYFDKKSVSKYSAFTHPQKSEQELLEAFEVRGAICYVAEDKSQILGYILGRASRIINLFVLGTAHNKGVGRSLVELFEKEAGKQNTSVIKIRSSLYATPFYQKMGYKKTTGVRNFRGLKVQPMQKIIKT